MKTVWITAFNKQKDAARVSAVSRLLKRYGLATQWHFWVGDPATLAWRRLEALAAARQRACESFDALWPVALRCELARGARLGLPGRAVRAVGQHARRYRSPHARKRHHTRGESSRVAGEDLVARANVAKAGEAQNYRLEVVGEEQLGQWFAICPREGVWTDAVFGAHGGDAKIDFQGQSARAARCLRRPCSSTRRRASRCGWASALGGAQPARSGRGLLRRAREGRARVDPLHAILQQKPSAGRAVRLDNTRVGHSE